MANVFDYKKENLDDITLDYMKEMAVRTMSAGITRYAILGCRGDTFFLFGESRKSEVSFRNYCGFLEILITDLKGNFIIYNKLNGLSFNELIEEYYRQFLVVKDLIEIERTKTFGDDWVNDDVAKGFLNVWKEIKVTEDGIVVPIKKGE